MFRPKPSHVDCNATIMKQQTILLRTKYIAPVLQDELVHRPRLLERLNASGEQQVILVSAPAGYGKTTIVAEWLAVKEGPVAWLTLSETENEPSLFVQYLLAAFSEALPNRRLRILDIFTDAQLPPSSQIASSFVNELHDILKAMGSSPIYLVLDDYHLITDPVVHEFVSTIILHKPTQLRMVVVSRSDPQHLPINRLRANQQLTEIRQADLTFSREESREFLTNALDSAIDDQVISEIDSILEGWIVGLHLAALSMQTQDNLEAFVESMKGRNRYVTAYLLDEVIHRQSQSVQKLLLRLSILPFQPRF